MHSTQEQTKLCSGGTAIIIIMLSPRSTSIRIIYHESIISRRTPTSYYLMHFYACTEHIVAKRFLFVVNSNVGVPNEPWVVITLSFGYSFR